MTHGVQFRRSVFLVPAVALACLLGSLGVAVAQDEETPKSNPNPLREAYERSKTAESIADFDAMIVLIEEGLANESAKENVDYGNRLAAWTHNQRGEKHAEADPPNDEAAMADFQAAIKYDPSKWSYFHNRGVSYGISGDYEKALGDFDKAIQLQPNSAKVYFNRGEIKSALGDIQGAIADYTQAIRLNPRDADAYNSRGFSYYKLGNYRAAFNDYNQALRIDNRHVQAYTNRGDAYGDQGRFNESLRDYQQAVGIDPENGRAFLSAAWLRATCPVEQFRNAEVGLRNANKALEFDGESDRYLDVLAASLANAGQFEEAVATEEKAIAMGQEDGAPEETLELYRKRLELYKEGKPYRDVRQASGT